MLWRYEMPTDALIAALNADPRTWVGARLTSISIVGRDAAGRAQRLTLHGELERSVRGEEFRDVLARSFGPHAIRSTLFDVRSANRTFVFSGRGFGHGVGLCQAGALARLRAGFEPYAVLQHYFPGTKLIRLR